MVSRVGFCCAITLIMLIMCLKHCTGEVRPKMRVTHPVHGLLNLLVDELLFIQVARDGTTNLRAKVVHCPQASLQTQSHTLLYMSTQTGHTHRYTCPPRQITHTAIHVHPDRSHTLLHMSIQTDHTHHYTSHTTTHVHPDKSHTYLTCPFCIFMCTAPVCAHPATISPVLTVSHLFRCIYPVLPASDLSLLALTCRALVCSCPFCIFTICSFRFLKRRK